MLSRNNEKFAQKVTFSINFSSYYLSVFYPIFRYNKDNKLRSPSCQLVNIRFHNLSLMLLQILFLKETRLLFVFWTNGCRIIPYRILPRKTISLRQLLLLKRTAITIYVGLLPVEKSICVVMLPWQRPLFSFDLLKRMLKV